MARQMEPRLSRVGFSLTGRPRPSRPMYYVPPPDYRGYVQPTAQSATFVAPENLIPTPDYARYEPQIDYELPSGDRTSQGRPRLPNGKNEQPARTQPAEEAKSSVQPRLAQIREEPPKANYPVTEDHRLKPLVVDTRPVYTERSQIRETPTKRPLLEQPSPYAVHSYLEDRDKLETGSFLNESTRTHIRSIGVPVLPPLGRDFPDFSGGPSPAQNKAFLRHLENHRKFDTMKSLKSCKDCPLCQMMMGTGWQEEVEERTRGRRPDVRDLFNEAGESDFDWALTRKSYSARAEGEITVGFREKVRVLKTEDTHLLCRKTDGSMGWLPINVVQQHY